MNPPVTSSSVWWSPTSGEWSMLTACPRLPLGFSGPWGTSFSQCYRKNSSADIHNTAIVGGASYWPHPSLTTSPKNDSKPEWLNPKLNNGKLANIAIYIKQFLQFYILSYLIGKYSLLKVCTLFQNILPAFSCYFRQETFCWLNHSGSHLLR